MLRRIKHMKKLPLLLAALFCFGAINGTTANAAPEVIVENGRPVHYVTRKVFVIENHRPVRREIFVDDGGRYFRIEKGRRVFVEHVYEKYPDQYFDKEGRVRPGVTINF